MRYLKVAADIVSKMGVPHWINGSNPDRRNVSWEIPTWLDQDSSKWTFTNWHEPSGQPNDHTVKETCIFIGPNGKVTNQIVLKTSIQL